MFTNNDLEFLGDFNLKKPEYQKFLIILENFDWNKESLDRKDGLSLTGHSKVIFYDHFETCKKFEYSNQMYGTAIDDDSKKLRALSYSILDDILKLFPNFTYIKGEISCCYPNSEQRFHIDPRVFHRYAKRIHLPLITNNQSFLDIESNSYHLEKGKLYEFNNIKLHRSKNLGETKRVHIIVDIIQLSTLNCCEKMFSETLYKKVNYTDQNF